MSRFFLEYFPLATPIGEILKTLKGDCINGPNKYSILTSEFIRSLTTAGCYLADILFLHMVVDLGMSLIPGLKPSANPVNNLFTKVWSEWQFSSNCNCLLLTGVEISGRLCH